MFFCYNVEKRQRQGRFFVGVEVENSSFFPGIFSFFAHHEGYDNKGCKNTRACLFLVKGGREEGERERGMTMKGVKCRV